MNQRLVPREAEIDLLAYLRKTLTDRGAAAQVRAAVAEVTDMQDLNAPVVHAAIVDATAADHRRQDLTLALAVYAPSRALAWDTSREVFAALLEGIDYLEGYAALKIDAPIYDPTGLDRVHVYRFAAKIRAAIAYLQE